jgi:hypothetical protein
MKWFTSIVALLALALLHAMAYDTRHEGGGNWWLAVQVAAWLASMMIWGWAMYGKERKR